MTCEDAKHLSRELREETGIGIDELDAQPGVDIFRCRKKDKLRLPSQQPLDDLRRKPEHRFGRCQNISFLGQIVATGACWGAS
jgi:hypothetical protein